MCSKCSWRLFEQWTHKEIEKAVPQAAAAAIAWFFVTSAKSLFFNQKTGWGHIQMYHWILTNLCTTWTTVLHGWMFSLTSKPVVFSIVFCQSNFKNQQSQGQTRPAWLEGSTRHLPQALRHLVNAGSRWTWKQQKKIGRRMICLEAIENLEHIQYSRRKRNFPSVFRSSDLKASSGGGGSGAFSAGGGGVCGSSMPGGAMPAFKLWVGEWETFRSHGCDHQTWVFLLIQSNLIWG